MNDDKIKYLIKISEVIVKNYNTFEENKLKN